MVRHISNIVVVLLTFLALVGVVGCNNEILKSADESTEEDYEENKPGGSLDDYDSSDDAISFSTLLTSESSVSRGSVIEEFEMGDDMGVYAYRLPSDGSVNPLEVSPNFMYNQQVIKLKDDEDSAWGYTPTKYWSSDAEDTYLFFGYAPYSANEENTMYHSTVNDTISYPVIVHSSPSEMFESRDLVLAGRKCYKYDDNGDLTTVNLKFEHVLSRIRFEFLNNLNAEEKTYSMVVKSIKLINVTTQSAFTYEDDPDPNSETGLLLVEYLADEVQRTGTISGSIKSGALLGAGTEGDIDDNGYAESAYIPYYASGTDNYQEYTKITPDGEYLYIDPYIIGSSRVTFEIEVEVFAKDYLVTHEEVWVPATTNTSYIEVTNNINAMERGGSYVWQIAYMPIEGSGLMVYVIEYWDDIYNKHDI